MSERPDHRQERLTRYFDGTLDAVERVEVEDELARDPQLAAELAELMQLELAALDAAPARPVTPDVSAPRVSVDAAPLTGAARPAVGKPRRRSRIAAGTDQLRSLPAPTPKPARTARRRWTRPALVSGAGLALIAAAAVLLLRPVPPAPPDLRAALAPTRALEARLGEPAADAHRPYQVERASETGREPLPLSLLAELEARGDHRALVAALVLSGERERARTLLDADGTAGAAALTDRAALALADGATEDALRATARALALSPGHGPALWNRALALRDLGLPRAAAEAFDEVAALAEPGWSDEARERAAALRSAADARAESYRDALAAGRAMVRGGPLIPEPLVLAHPGTARLYFYDAVRAASGAGVARLRPLAELLERTYRTDALSQLIDRAAAQPEEERAPLAAAYLRVLDDAASARETSRLIERARRDGAADIALGAMYLADVAPADLPAYRTLARAARDPWFDDLADHVAARVARAAGDGAGAEATLLAAVARCDTPEPRYRCRALHAELAGLYLDQQRIAEAQASAERAWNRARRDGVVGDEAHYLWLVGDALRLGHRFELARAHLRESLLATVADGQDGCSLERKIATGLAYEHTAADDWSRAVEIMDAAPRCETPDSLQAAVLLVTLARGTEARRWADEARATLAALTARGLPGGAALLARYLGARLDELDEPGTGTDALRAVIADAERLRAAGKADRDVDGARAFAYGLLVSQAAASGDFGAALDLAVAEQGSDAAPTCAVALSLHESTLVVAARAADGRALGIAETWRGNELEPAQLVPAQVSAALADCALVDVIARPPAPVSGRLLPPQLPWRLRTGLRRVVPGSAPGRLVVQDVRPPASLALPALSAQPVPDEDDTVVLTGAAATPARVLAALADVGYAELHSHGLVDLAVSDASFLALSPDETGRFALTAAMVRSAELAGAPVVVLGACESGRSAPYATRAWSLPVALLEAGARAVIAATEPLPDRGAAEILASIRARIAAGATAAEAVRDERARSGDPSSWIHDLVVFE